MTPPTGLVTTGIPGSPVDGFFTGGNTGQIAGAFGGGTYANIGASLFIGGVISKAQGGKFISGVKGAAVAMGLARVAGAVRDAADAKSSDYQGEIYDLNNSCRAMTTDEAIAHQDWMANAVAAEWPSLPQGVVNAAAGFGDVMSFGAASYLRSQWDIGSVDYDNPPKTTGAKSRIFS